MKKIIVILVIVLGLSLASIYKVSADIAPSETQPNLPQSTAESNDRQATQQIESPQFFSEDSKTTFLKGIGVGLVVGVIVGGTVAWFFRRRLA